MEFIFFIPACLVSWFAIFIYNYKHYKFNYFKLQLMQRSNLEPDQHLNSYTFIVLIGYEGTFP